jgi:hypothetical protein
MIVRCARVSPEKRVDFRLAYLENSKNDHNTVGLLRALILYAEGPGPLETITSAARTR